MEAAELFGICEPVDDEGGCGDHANSATRLAFEDIGRCVATNELGWITRRGFMAHWA